MKKKNVLTMAMSVALVGVIAVGGTMAYLTARDDAVTNSFQFVTGDDDGKVITVELAEPQPAAIGSETITSKETGKGWNYANVVPGQKLNKAPEISVTAYTPSYVFIKVEEGSNVTVDQSTFDTSDWNKLEGVVGVNNVYYHEVTAENIAAIEEGEDPIFDLGAIFQKVNVANIDVYDDNGDVVALDDITIYVAAVAKGSFTTPAEAYNSANVANLFTAAANE